MTEDFEKEICMKTVPRGMCSSGHQFFKQFWFPLVLSLSLTTLGVSYYSHCAAPASTGKKKILERLEKLW